MLVLHSENDEVSDNENKLNTERQQRTMMSDERIDNQKRRRQRVKVKRSKVFPVISKLNTCLVLYSNGDLTEYNGRGGLCFLENRGEVCCI
jgi:hypothetical protein